MVVRGSKGFPVGRQYGLLHSLNGSELWAPVLQVVYDVVLTALQGFPIRGPECSRGAYDLLWSCGLKGRWLFAMHRALRGPFPN